MHIGQIARAGRLLMVKTYPDGTRFCVSKETTLSQSTRVMDFTKLKDRVWKSYDWLARQFTKLPKPFDRFGFGIVGVILWVAWALPKVPVRQAFRDLSRLTGRASAFTLFRHYVKKFILLAYRMELIRQGRTVEIGELLDIPERDRFDSIIARGGAIFMMPHVHGSVTMAEALGQIHPLLLFVRATKDDGRAGWQRQYYDQMTCDVIDVRRADDVVSSRKMLGALRDGKIILGGGDFIKPAPEMAEDPADDVVRVEAFGQPVGAMRWPARFAAKVGVPLVPVTIVQSEDKLTLIMGDEIMPGDIVETTQAWMDGIVDLIHDEPADWVFCLDRHWRKVMSHATPRDAA